TSGFGSLGGIIFSCSIVAFAIPSILGWYYYARECLRYLFKGKLMLYIYQIIFLVLLVFGAQLQLTFVWDVA
ncbi:alanine:cation symporter family protein, partial [Desulfovibrio desulfuricans]|nr:alanine:cation symporter family protein [Desulfovibrio desulfuricans]